jgi:AcrR family transcriptional regulator
MVAAFRAGAKREVAIPEIIDAAMQRGGIRAAARRCFAQRGVRGAGLTQVARAGVVAA